MMLKLQRYQFSVRYKKGKEFYVANTLSCVPVTDHPSTTSARKEYKVFPMELAEMNIETKHRIKQNLVKIHVQNRKARDKNCLQKTWFILFCHTRAFYSCEGKAQ